MTTPEPDILPDPVTLRREAKRIMREQHVNYTTAQMVAMKEYRLKQRIQHKKEN